MGRAKPGLRGVALWHLDADEHPAATDGAAAASSSAAAAGTGGEEAAAAATARTRLLVAEYSNNRVSVFGLGEDGGLVCTFLRVLQSKTSPRRERIAARAREEGEGVHPEDWT